MLDLSCGMEGGGGGKGKRGGEINRSPTTGLSSTGLISSHAHCTVHIQTPMGVSTSPINEGDRSGTFDGSPDPLIDQPYQDFPTPSSRPFPPRLVMSVIVRATLHPDAPAALELSIARTRVLDYL